MFTTLWNSAPILVSLISFFAYVYQGNQLTVPVAFTSIALFGMIRYNKVYFLPACVLINI